MANGLMWLWTTASPPAGTSWFSPNLSERTSSGALFWKKLMPSKHSLLISTAQVKSCSSPHRPRHDVDLFRRAQISYPYTEGRLTFNLTLSLAWGHDSISGVLNANPPVLRNVFISIRSHHSNEKPSWHTISSSETSFTIQFLTKYLTTVYIFLQCSYTN